MAVTVRGNLMPSGMQSFDPLRVAFNCSTQGEKSAPYPGFVKDGFNTAELPVEGSAECRVVARNDMLHVEIPILEINTGAMLEVRHVALACDLFTTMCEGFAYLSLVRQTKE